MQQNSKFTLYLHCNLELQISAFARRKFRAFSSLTVERSKICILKYFPERKSCNLLMNQDDLLGKFWGQTIFRPRLHRNGLKTQPKVYQQDIIVYWRAKSVSSLKLTPYIFIYYLFLIVESRKIFAKINNYLIHRFVVNFDSGDLAYHVL